MPNESLNMRRGELEFPGIPRVRSKRLSKLYSHLIEQSLGLICSHDLQGKLLLVNPAAAESLGYTPDEGIGRSLKEFLAPQVRGQFDLYLERIRANGFDSGRMRLLAKDGTERVWQYRNALYHEADYPPIVLGHALDITSGIRTEYALKQSEDRFRGLFDDAPVAYCELDGNGVFERVNRAACELIGRESEEIRGRRLWDFVPEDEREPCRRDIERSLRGEDGHAPILRMARPDGGRRVLEARLSLRSGGAGSLEGARCVLADITERIEAEQHVRDLNGELLRSNEELRQFASIVSHDLQAPLRQVASMLGRLSARYRGGLDGEGQSWMEAAGEGIERMSQLIPELLQYSISAHASPPAAQRVEMTAALEAGLANQQEAIVESGAVISHDPLPAVLAGPHELTRVFQNLIGNAIKYRGCRPPRIHVAAISRDGDWAIAVRDDGIGIAREDQERIFGLFERVNRDNTPGAGLGLAICKKIVERNGGQIWVESELGQGSTFYFTVPK